MINRLALGLAITLAACSQTPKEKAQSPAPKSEKAVDEGVIIASQAEPDTLKGSLKAYATGNINGTEIKIKYYSPAVRGRIIWGGLVPYDNVWVTGAHRAMSIEFDSDLLINGTPVTAGKYAFFTIPGKEQWTIILNRNWNQHLTDEYDKTEDVVRFTISHTTTDQRQERLRYQVLSEGGVKGRIEVHWDNLIIAIPVEVAGMN